jgi:Mrp family chromosome partitioning ATPase
LWLTTGEVFYKGAPGSLSVSWLRTRLAQLRPDFEYAMLQARPAGLYSDAALLGSLTGGVVLVLQADLTRRGPAQKVTETLRAANAHLLGTVLSNRSFPIPERIYRRL